MYGIKIEYVPWKKCSVKSLLTEINMKRSHL